jgi:hypothetical protein
MTVDSTFQSPKGENMGENSLSMACVEHAHLYQRCLPRRQYVIKYMNASSQRRFSGILKNLVCVCVCVCVCVTIEGCGLLGIAWC